VGRRPGGRVVSVLVSWMHPHRGRRHEVLCRRHEREVLAALRVLGIGCSGQNAVGTCDRCLDEASR